MGVIGSIFSGIFGANSATKAAKTQADAANHAADLQKQTADKALDFEKQVYGTDQANQQPFLQAGQGAIKQLSTDMQPGGSLAQGWDKTFVAPDAVTEQNDPGYQARLQMGSDALQGSASARGALLTGGTAKDLDKFSQDYASNEYSNVYSRAVNDYQMAYNQFQQNQTNQYNRLAGIAGTGQTSAQQLGAAGSSASGQAANTLATEGQQVGQNINNAGAATASGYIGQANAYNNMFSNINGGIMQALAFA